MTVFWTRELAEESAKMDSKVFPKYKFTVRAIQGKNQDYYVVNVTRKRATTASDKRTAKRRTK